MIAQSVLLFSLLSLQTLTSASISSSPRVLFAPHALQIRQSNDGFCSGTICSDGSCADIGYHCCSDGASCATGTDCVPNGCCPIGETCSGGGGTMTVPASNAVPTFSGYSGAVSTPMMTGGLATPAPGTLGANTLTSLDGYGSSINTAYATASGSANSQLGVAGSQQSALGSTSQRIPAAAATPSTTETSSRRRASATSTAAASQKSPAKQAAGNGAERGAFGSVMLAGAAGVGLVVALGVL